MGNQAHYLGSAFYYSCGSSLSSSIGWDWGAGATGAGRRAGSILPLID